MFRHMRSCASQHLYQQITCEEIDKKMIFEKATILRILLITSKQKLNQFYIYMQVTIFYSLYTLKSDSQATMTPPVEHAAAAKVTDWKLGRLPITL